MVALKRAARRADAVRRRWRAAVIGKAVPCGYEVIRLSPAARSFRASISLIAMADYDPESGLTYERPSSMVERQPNDNEK